MIRKTYGVSGLMDWTVQIKVGKAVVSVHFTGGALTAYGVTPAKFSTTNPFFQGVIENSTHFKNGRIMLLGEMEVPDDAATKERKRRAAILAKAKEGALSANVVEDVEQTEGNEAVDETEVSQEEVMNDEEDYTTVEVADKNEAVEYLKEHCNSLLTATQLRTKTAFMNACEEYKVRFVFAD